MINNGTGIANKTFNSVNNPNKYGKHSKRLGGLAFALFLISLAFVYEFLPFILLPIVVGASGLIYAIKSHLKESAVPKNGATMGFVINLLVIILSVGLAFAAFGNIR